jgi:hypothetical protein
LERKLANHSEVPKMPLRMSYGGRTYRCLKRVIRKDRKKEKR